MTSLRAHFRWRAADHTPSNTTPPPVDDSSTRAFAGLAVLIERITPWLLDLGTWVFGGLIAFNLLILSALLTVGPVDTAVLIATAGVALALPPDVAGFMLLRLAAEMKRVDVEQLATEAFVEGGFHMEPIGPVRPPAEIERWRARVILRFSYKLMALSVVITFIGVTAALWHMAWWIGAGFVGMAVAGQVIFLLAVSSAGTKATWSTPAGDRSDGGAVGRPDSPRRLRGPGGARVTGAARRGLGVVAPSDRR